jgi:hypothetical protein
MVSQAMQMPADTQSSKFASMPIHRMPPPVCTKGFKSASRAVEVLSKLVIQTISRLTHAAHAAQLMPAREDRFRN